MKFTVKQLRKIIKEEVNSAIITESIADQFIDSMDDQGNVIDPGLFKTAVWRLRQEYPSMYQAIEFLSMQNLPGARFNALASGKAMQSLSNTKKKAKNVVKEATRNPRNLEADLEEMTVGESLDIQIHLRSGRVTNAVIMKVQSPRGTWGMGPDGEEVELDAVYLLELKDRELEFTYPTEITDFFMDEGWEFSY